tara:strand:+ start:869 stop:1030 length:162 start_codon:yes stop_codon:yes gene_type:complete
MSNLKKVFVKHILDRTNEKDIPKIVLTEFNGDYKMYLYTLTTPELGDLILMNR